MPGKLVAYLLAYAAAFFAGEALAIQLGLSELLDLLKPVPLLSPALPHIVAAGTLLVFGNAAVAAAAAALALLARAGRLRAVAPLAIALALLSLPVGGGFLIGAGLVSLAASEALWLSAKEAIAAGRKGG